MKYIAHRINTIVELNKTPEEYGVEIDLRDSGNRLILQHDPFSEGDTFEDYLKSYKHNTMILNIKSEQIEHKALELLAKYNIKDYFLLDSSFPMIYSLIKQGEKNIALRFSEFEKMDTILSLAGKATWVWVDCFSVLPIDKESYKALKDSGFKLCLVSPELQSRDHEIETYKEYLIKENIVFDAICTKMINIKRWES